MTPSAPVDVVQIDDGHQNASVTGSPSLGRFHLPGWLAATIRARGHRAGIWTAPFLVDPRSELAAVHPRLARPDLRRQPLRAGRSPATTCTSWTPRTWPAAYRIEVFAVLRIEGYDYYSGRLLRRRAGRRTALRGRRSTAYREGIALIREADRTTAYLLGCRAPILPSSSLDALRVSPTRPRTVHPGRGLGQPGLNRAEFTGRGRQRQHGRLWSTTRGQLMASPRVRARALALYWSTTGGLMTPATGSSPSTTGASPPPAACIGAPSLPPLPPLPPSELSTNETARSLRVPASPTAATTTPSSGPRRSGRGHAPDARARGDP